MLHEHYYLSWLFFNQINFVSNFGSNWNLSVKGFGAAMDGLKHSANSNGVKKLPNCSHFVSATNNNCIALAQYFLAPLWKVHSQRWKCIFHSTYIYVGTYFLKNDTIFNVYSKCTLVFLWLHKVTTPSPAIFQHLDSQDLVLATV